MMHTCHAHGCKTPVPPKLFMCKSQWYSLRKAIRDAIWKEYQPRQEVLKNPSLRYLAVQQRAIAEAVFQPYNEAAALLSLPYAMASELWRQKAIIAGLGDPLEGLVQKSSECA